ncbi:hypothetical protein J4403_04250 [Candidatus Woesearchaeota archaeon]|nr:hypothetical protein [Candidatus Woesearchaeota archaeon]
MLFRNFIFPAVIMAIATLVVGEIFASIFAKEKNGRIIIKRIFTVLFIIVLFSFVGHKAISKIQKYLVYETKFKNLPLQTAKETVSKDKKILAKEEVEDTYVLSRVYYAEINQGFKPLSEQAKKDSDRIKSFLENIEYVQMFKGFVIINFNSTLCYLNNNSEIKRLQNLKFKIIKSTHKRIEIEILDEEV